MSNNNNDLQFLFYSTKQISYMPELTPLTGSVNATILLLRVLHWAAYKNFQPFYKYARPCKDEYYKEGDSWTEELGFSRSEFEGARERIGTCLSAAPTNIESKDVDGHWLPREHILYYWVDGLRRTWYVLNTDLLVYYLGTLNEKYKVMAADNKLLKIKRIKTDTTSDSIEKALPKKDNFTLLEEKVRTWIKKPSISAATIQRLNTEILWYDPRIAGQRRSTPNELYGTEQAYQDWFKQQAEPYFDKVKGKFGLAYDKFLGQVCNLNLYTTFLNQNKTLYQQKEAEQAAANTAVVDDEDWSV